MASRQCRGSRTKSQTLGGVSSKTLCTVPEAPQIRRWLGRCKAGGSGHWEHLCFGHSIIRTILEAGTWGILGHLPPSLLPAACTQGTAPPAHAEGLCGDNRMCHLCCHTTHIGSLRCLVPLPSPGSRWGLPRAGGSSPHCSRDLFPRQHWGHGQSTGTPVALWGSQHPPRQAGRDRTNPCAFPHGARETHCTPSSPVPPLSPHICPFPRN